MIARIIKFITKPYTILVIILLVTLNSTLHSCILSHPIRVGEVGVVNENYSYGDVRRYGAIGDGIKDDHDAINYALTQNHIVYFQHDKVYKCNDGFYMNDGQIIKGNGATLLIDKDFAPKSDKAYGFIRYKYGATYGKYQIDDLIIDSNSTHQSSPTSEFVLFDPTGFDTVIMNNVILKSEIGLQARLHLMYGCNGKNILNNVSLINNNQGMSGGCLWINNTSSSDVSLTCKDCYFYNTCSDEIFALYGTGGATCSFTGCKFVGTNTKYLKNTLCIAIYDNSNNQHSENYNKVNVEFNNCLFINNYYSTNSYRNLCILGAGTSNFNKIIVINFNNCNIINNSSYSVFASWSGISDFSSYDYPYNTQVNLNNCFVNSNGAISGAYRIWELYGISSLPALSLNAKGSNISCVYSIFDVPNNQSEALKSNIEDCVIRITNSLAIFRTVYKTPIALNFENNFVIADNSVGIVKTLNTTTPNPKIPKHSIQFVSYKANVLNNTQLKNSTQFIALN